MERAERNRPRFIPAGTSDAGAGDVGRALKALSDADLVRLKSLARLWSRGLPGGIGWADVLNEAILRSLDGSRRWPPDVPLLAFLSGVMRSIRDEHWRRARRDHALLVASPDADGSVAAPDNPERVLAAAQALGAINVLFADDPAALKILAGLAEGMTAGDIRLHYDMSEREYDSTRKRMRRALLRQGLA
ncbi:MAG: sigma-70 family RNA polymerase sigma factor [Reyranellaceae bacterium]